MWSTRLICSSSIPSKWKGTATDSEVSFPSEIREAKFVRLFVRHSLTLPNIIKISWLQLKTKAAYRYLSQCSSVYWKYFVHPSFPSRLHLTMLSTHGRGDSRKTNKGGPSFPANQATKKAQTAPRHGSCKELKLPPLLVLFVILASIQKAAMLYQRATHNTNNSSTHNNNCNWRHDKNSSKMNVALWIKIKSDSDDVVEVICDRPRGRGRARARKRVHVTGFEEDLEARIERTVKCLVPDVIQAVLSSHSRPAALTVSNNSDVSATSWSGTIQAAGPAQTQLGNQSIASNSLSRKSDRSNRLSVTDMQDFFGQTGQLNPQSAPPVGVASTAPFLISSY